MKHTHLLLFRIFITALTVVSSSPAKHESFRNASEIGIRPWTGGDLIQQVFFNSNNASQIEINHPKKILNVTSIVETTKSGETIEKKPQLPLPAQSLSSKPENQTKIIGGNRQERENGLLSTPKSRELRRKKQRKNQPKATPKLIEMSTTKPKIRQEKRLTEKGARRRAERRKGKGASSEGARKAQNKGSHRGKPWKKGS